MRKPRPRLEKLARATIITTYGYWEKQSEVQRAPHILLHPRGRKKKGMEMQVRERREVVLSGALCRRGHRVFRGQLFYETWYLHRLPCASDSSGSVLMS